jgi:hypothetical protein
MLITINDIANIRPITQNLSDLNSIEPYIEEAEQVEFKKLLGSEFYFDLKKTYAQYLVNVAAGTVESPYAPTAKEILYNKLLTGAEYQNLRGNTVEFGGLKTVLAYFSYARFIINDNLKHTNAGMMLKRTEYSEQPSAKAITDKANDAKSIAMSFWSDCKMYLDEKTSDYSLWDIFCHGHHSSVNSRTRISGVNNRDRSYINHKDRYVPRNHNNS